MLPMKLAPRLAPEIIWFTPSEEYLDDPSVVLDTIHQQSVHKGLLGSYYGAELDNPATGVWVMAWQSLAKHQSFMEEESYMDFILPVTDSMVGAGRITQLSLDHGDLQRALNAPVTQFIYITVRPLHDREYELQPLISLLQTELKIVPGCMSSCWGSSIEDDHLEIGVVGWRSMADRNAAVKGRLSSTIRRIRELCTVEIRYAKLRYHSEVAPPAAEL
ncbi:hypothetical protein CC2G_012778 [Coprinopsis cinerea AmutBmut pab1-1]|nr:hypothetical protein CC2G_012778 [Coprinopsis cinerea AmutBmut pab1-1]